MYTSLLIIYSLQNMYILNRYQANNYLNTCDLCRYAQFSQLGPVTYFMLSLTNFIKIILAIAECA